MRNTKLVAALLAAAVASLVSPAADVRAQAWPTKPIQIVLPYAPGAATDMVARLVQPRLAAGLGQPIVIENRAGGAGNIGSAYVARSPGDGYRLLLTTSAVVTINPHVYKDIGFDPLRDLAPITTAVLAVLGIGVHSSLGVSTLPELVAYGKKHPKTLFYGTSGAGTPQHAAGELLNQIAGIDMAHVPYKGGGPVIADLAAGHIKVGIVTLSALLPHVESGNVKVVAIGEAKRFEGAPTIPTIAETYPGFEASSWLAFYAPAGTPREIVSRLNAELVAALNADDVKAKLRTAGMPVVADRPDDLAQRMKTELEGWGKVVRERGIQAN